MTKQERIAEAKQVLAEVRANLRVFPLDASYNYQELLAERKLNALLNED
jgi:hypothetical protein